jgi:ABC-type uncharacterized transport system permease subunit
VSLHTTLAFGVPILQIEGDSTMGNGLWFITILKEQPWIGIAFGILLFLLLFWLKKWAAKKLMADQESE